MVVYGYAMESIRVPGIGDTRRPIAKVLMDYMTERVGHEVPGTSIRALLVRSGVDTWEGSKVLGALRSAGVIGVVAEQPGSGPMTWRRKYTKLAEWDDTEKSVIFSDTTPHQKRAYETPGKWVRLPEGVGMKGLNQLRDAGFELAYFMRYIEGSQTSE